MKVGEYVRTKWGCIAKFEGINEGFYEFDNIIMDESSAVREKLFVDIIEKSSPNIIDLIEVGDYVNGYLVTTGNQNVGSVYILEIDGLGLKKKLYEKDIKSIVTHEQFEAMKYEIK